MRRTNVDGLVHATRAAVHGMKLRGFGHEKEAVISMEKRYFTSDLSNLS